MTEIEEPRTATMILDRHFRDRPSGMLLKVERKTTSPGRIVVEFGVYHLTSRGFYRLISGHPVIELEGIPLEDGYPIYPDTIASASNIDELIFKFLGVQN